MKAILNGTIYSPTQIIHDGVVLIDQGTIRAVGTRAATTIPQYAEIIDASGNAIIPGLIDIHTYGNQGVSMTAPERVAAELPTFARNVTQFGVTSFLISPTMGDHHFIVRILAAIADTIPTVRGGAQALGIHLEGPWLDPEQRGAFPRDVLRVPSLQDAREYVHAAKGYLRLVTLAPNFSESLDVARYLLSVGVQPSLGHSNTSFEVALDALQIFPLVTHVYNAMSGLHHRKPGVLGAVLSSDKANGMLICDGIHAHPAAVKILLRSLGTNRIILVTDSIPGGGLAEGKFTMLNQIAHIIDGVARLTDGTIAGSILTLNRAVMNARAFGDVSFSDAIKMATQNPARALGLSNKGQLVAGADADVVIMNDSGDVKMTLVAGEIVHHA